MKIDQAVVEAELSFAFRSKRPEVSTLAVAPVISGAENSDAYSPYRSPPTCHTALVHAQRPRSRGSDAPADRPRDDTSSGCIPRNVRTRVIYHRRQSPALPSARAKQLRKYCRARVRQRPPGRCRAIHVPRRIAKPVPMRRNPVPSLGSPRAPRYRRRFSRFPATLGRQFDRPAKFIKNFHGNLPRIWILPCGTKLVPSIRGHGLGRFEKG